MLLVHVISRGLCLANAHRIQIGKAEQRRHFTITVTPDGKIEADKGKAVVVEAGIRIAEVCTPHSWREFQNNTVLLRLVRRI